MKFELTISGLCILAMKAGEERPEHPEAVDVIVPAIPHHRCRFVWNPLEVEPQVEPEMVVDTNGQRYASLSLERDALDLSFEDFEGNGFAVHWGPPETEAPSAPWEETWLNWVPRLSSLGLNGFEIPEPGQLPAHAAARLTLPFGTIASRNMIVDNDVTDYVLWEFKDGVRALANEIVYTVDGPDEVVVMDSQAGEIVRVGAEGGFQTVRMCISNDMEIVPKKFTTGIDALSHLEHLVDIAGEGSVFHLPKKVTGPNTGRKICDQVVYIYG